MSSPPALGLPPPAAAAAAAAAVAAAAAPPAPAATIPGGAAPVASHISPRIFSIQQSCDTATPAPEPTLATVLGASNNPGSRDEPLDANAEGNDSEEIAPPLPPPSSATFSLSPLAGSATRTTTAISEFLRTAATVWTFTASDCLLIAAVAEWGDPDISAVCDTWVVTRVLSTPKVTAASECLPVAVDLCASAASECLSISSAWSAGRSR
mmetsp:Transcript_24734/g.61629  ORF Transcript_24734/g.61629 Transcript_24734/m.61629 type:complete len:210 (-) Transcript_24734:973-1602(-)